MADTSKLLSLAKECGAETGACWVKFHRFEDLAAFEQRIRQDERERLIEEIDGMRSMDRAVNLTAREIIANEVLEDCIASIRSSGTSESQEMSDEA
jgi:hypothetical protein